MSTNSDISFEKALAGRGNLFIKDDPILSLEAKTGFNKFSVDFSKSLQQCKRTLIEYLLFMFYTGE